MLMCSFRILCVACIVPLVTGQIYRSSTCYGTASEDLLNVTCSEGTIYITDILTGAKLLSEGCPPYDHQEASTDLVERERCCNYDHGDCLRPYRGYSYDDILDRCNGQRNCFGVPTVFQRTNVSCQTSAYPDFTHYMAVEFECKPDGHIHGACNDSIDCLDPNANCFEELCKCQELYTDFVDTCWKDGALNGSCEVDTDCTDENTYCETNLRCACLTGYSSIDGTCIQDGTISGACLTGSTCLDPNAICEAGTCRCKDLYTKFDDVCWQDGRYNGSCNVDSDCLDANNVCEGDGRCACASGYSEIDGTCVQDGTISGACLTGPPCHDTNAICDAGICRCKGLYTEFDDVCWQDGALNGSCDVSSDCSDDNTYCAQNLRCACISGYSDIDGICKQDGTISGACLSDSTCLSANTICDEGICRCVDQYTEFDGICWQDGSINGSCNVESDCLDANTVCGGSNRCVCATGYSEINGECVKDGTISGACLTDSTCLDPNAICDAGICRCKDLYTEFDEVCWQDGSINGSCSVDVDCVDANTFCSEGQRCACTSGYSAVDGVCIKDGTISGACLAVSLCVDPNAICEDGYCRCQHLYTVIDGVCKQDGSISGACSSGSTCIDPNAICDAGICRCKDQYTEYDDVCWQDGAYNGNCTVGTDCQDDNTDCHINSRCACVTGYTYLDGSCKEDGKLDGACLETGVVCTDIHAVCLEGLCQCNAIRHYVNRVGVCIRDDGHLNGRCNDTMVCEDAHALCDEGYCTCNTGYNEVNGICEQASSPSVTNCKGDHTYNKTMPDCRPSETVFILQEYDVTKRTSTSCGTEMDTYDAATFEQCCTYGQGDCITEVDEPSACEPPEDFLEEPNYKLIDYICVQESDSNPVIDIDEDGEVTGNGVVITSPGYPGNGVTSDTDDSCSVQASCQTTINVTLVLLRLAKTAAACRSRLEISDNGTTTTLTCSNNTDTRTYSEWNLVSSGPYIVVTLTSVLSGTPGRFVLRFEGSDPRASVTVACGDEMEIEVTIGSCEVTAGYLGGECSPNNTCFEEHVVCTDGVCACADGYTSVNGICSSQDVQCEGDDCGTSSSAKMIVVISLLVLLLLAVLFVLFCCFKDKIKRKLCPQKDIEKVEPIVFHEIPVVESTPSNTKFPGRPELANGILPPPVLMDTTPMRTKFQRHRTTVGDDKPTLKRQMTMTDYLRKEQSEYDKVIEEKNLQRSDSFPARGGLGGTGSTLLPANLLPPLPSGDGADAHAKENKKKKKKKKRLRQLKGASIGVFAATKGFDLQRTRAKAEQNGVYRPSEGSNPVANSTVQHDNTQPGVTTNAYSGHPAPSLVSPFDARNSWQRAGSATAGQYSVTSGKPSGHPQLQRRTPFGHEPRNFDAKGAWRRAGNLSSVVVMPSVMRKKAKIEITSIDDPNNIEETEFDV